MSDFISTSDLMRQLTGRLGRVVRCGVLHSIKVERADSLPKPLRVGVSDLWPAEALPIFEQALRERWQKSLPAEETR